MLTTEKLNIRKANLCSRTACNVHLLYRSVNDFLALRARVFWKQNKICCQNMNRFLCFNYMYFALSKEKQENWQKRRLHILRLGCIQYLLVSKFLLNIDKPNESPLHFNSYKIQIGFLPKFIKLKCIFYKFDSSSS